jgi:hypothetical protein
MNNLKPKIINVLKEKLLTKHADLLTFTNLYHAKGGVNTTVGYLENCRVVKVFEDQQGIWQAGYCINDSSTMRYLEPFEPLLKKRILKDKNLNEEDLAEITQIWMNRTMLLDDTLRLKIYFSSINDGILAGKPFLIGGSKVASVWKSYENILPHELYFGLVPFKHGLELGKIVYNTTEGASNNLDIYKSTL